jgi:hypothetical protein
LLAEALKLPLVGWKDLHECGGVYEQIGNRERIGLRAMEEAICKIYSEPGFADSIDIRGGTAL